MEAADDRSSEEEEDTTPVIPSESSHQANEEEVPVQVECEGDTIGLVLSIESVLGEDCECIFGSTPMYTFYRLYCILYTRILHSKTLCDSDLYTEQNMTAHAGRYAVKN